jgi:D-ribose pyranase
MKKSGILNAELSRIVAGMGHSDRLVICDSGLPIPRCAAPVVDLALTRNVPRFLETLRVVLEEAEIEQAVIASEMEAVNPATFRGMTGLLPNIPLTRVPHEEFKKLIANGSNIAFVRTGEATPYSNVMLISGVTFD